MCVCQQPEALRAYELTGSVRSADTNTHTHYGPKPRTRNRKVAWINALRVQQESGDGVLCMYYVCVVHIICMYSIDIQIHARRLQHESGVYMIYVYSISYVCIPCIRHIFTHTSKAGTTGVRRGRDTCKRVEHCLPPPPPHTHIHPPLVRNRVH